MESRMAQALTAKGHDAIKCQGWFFLPAEELQGIQIATIFFFQMTKKRSNLNIAEILSPCSNNNTFCTHCAF